MSFIWLYYNKINELRIMSSHNSMSSSIHVIYLILVIHIFKLSYDQILWYILANLSTFLENEEYSIEQHLKIILSVFTGSDLSVLKNKIFALSWMKQKLFDEKLSDDKKNLIYSVLKLCISNTIDVLLYPNISEPILTVKVFCC